MRALDPTQPVPSSSAAGVTVAYVTDVEGRWDKLHDFARDNPAVRLEGDRLEVADGAVLVFGGDALDRGPHARRLVRALLDVKDRQPEQVVLLAGNRDLNKMRLPREMHGILHPRTPRDMALGPRDALLRWIFENTMGAREAYEHRRAELAREGADSSDARVVDSYLEDLEPGGPLCAYLRRCQLAWRCGPTLFVHGAVTEQSLGHVPDGSPSTPDVNAWIDRLNTWCRVQVEAFAQDERLRAGDPAWAPLIAYQAPAPGTRLNQASVVYGRLTDDRGDPYLPARSVADALRDAGVRRVVVGHTPVGETPCVVRGAGLEVVMADNSYAALEHGVKLVVRDEHVDVRGTMPDGARAITVAFRTHLDDRDARVGLRDKRTGHLVKGRTEDGRYVLYKCEEGYRRDHRLEDEATLASRELVEPWA